MKYFISIFVLIFSAVTATSLYAHTNRLHKNRFEIRQEHAEKAASIKLLKDNKFNDQIKSLQTLQDKISSQRNPEARLKSMDRYITELQDSINTMQQMVNQYGSEADHIVVTHGNNMLPLSYRFTMMQQLLQSSSILQKFIIEQLKLQGTDIPSFNP